MKKPLAAIILSGMKKDKEDEESSSSVGDELWDALMKKDKDSFMDALGAYIHECTAEYEESEHEEG